MALPQAPMKLRAQIKQGSNIVITIPLRGIGAPPTFLDGGTTFNSGDPTMTFTFTIPVGAGNCTDEFLDVVCSAVEDAWQKGTATVT